MTAYTLREGSPQSAGMDPARIQQLHSLLSGWVARGDTPSVVALIARRGVIVMHEAFGVRRYGDATPTLKLDSIFPLASASKPLTAAAIMCLVDDGLIGLNRAFVDYIPELDVPEVDGLSDAKVADLLSHTAGIDDFGWGPLMAAAAQRNPEIPPPGAGQHGKLNRLIWLARGLPLAYQPGKAFVYSGMGYNFLGDIVRRTSGQPFWKFVQSRVFQPLGMNDSYFVLPAALRDRRVYRAPGMPGAVPNPLHGGIDSPERDELDLGSGGGSSTAKDLAVFLQMILNGGIYNGRRVLSAGSVAAMIRDQVDPTIPAMWLRRDPVTGNMANIQERGGAYGFGFVRTGRGFRFRANGSLASASAIGHAGFGGVGIWADPERELLGVFLSVSPRMDRDFYLVNSDLFQNAAIAAVLD